MTLTATKAIEGTYEADQIHSVFGFLGRTQRHPPIEGPRRRQRHAARRRGRLELEGAKVESISIRDEEFRACRAWRGVLQPTEHPGGPLPSSSIELSEDLPRSHRRRARDRRQAQEVTATGTYRPIIPTGTARRVRARDKFDRRDFGFDWQMELPSGGNVLDWDVTLNVHLELVKAGEGE